MADKGINNSDTTLLSATVSNTSIDEDVFYFITNYGGEEVELNVTRFVHKCHCKDHENYTIYYTDKDTKECKRDERQISSNKVNLYYYDLFHNFSEMARKGFEAGNEIGTRVDDYLEKDSTIGEMAGSLVGAGAGAAIGEIKDIWTSVSKFVGLPTISPNDNDYYYYTNLVYNSCCHDGIAPDIMIVSYPDIAFSVKVGIFNFEYKIEKNRSVGNDGKDTSKWDEKGESDLKKGSLELSVEYNGQTKKISFETKDDESEKDKDKKKEGGIINGLISVFKLLKDLYETTVTVANACKTAGGVAGVLAGSGKAMVFTLSISPELEVKWKYSVSENLRQVGKNVKGSLGVEVKGELVIDIVIIALKIGEGIAIAASGGLALAIFKVIEFLVGFAKLLGNKSKNFDFYLDLVVTPVVDGKIKGEWNTVKKNQWEGSGASVEVRLTFEIRIGAAAKGSMMIKFKLEARGGASIGCRYKIYLDFEKGAKVKHSINLGSATAYALFESSFSFSIWTPWRDNEVSNYNITMKNKVEKKFDGWDFGPWIIWPKSGQSGDAAKRLPDKGQKDNGTVIMHD